LLPNVKKVYAGYRERVRKPIRQLRNVLESLEAKKKERQWLRNQTEGDLDDGKLVEAITGEKNVYKRRGEDPDAESSLSMEKPKRLRLVVDVSGSMYRFNGSDNRLERELEAGTDLLHLRNKFIIARIANMHVFLYHRMFQNIKECSRMFQNIIECSKICQNIIE
jgi:hypothetical protein